MGGMDHYTAHINGSRLKILRHFCFLLHQFFEPSKNHYFLNEQFTSFSYKKV